MLFEEVQKKIDNLNNSSLGAYTSLSYNEKDQQVEATALLDAVIVTPDASQKKSVPSKKKN
ncbi:hypothetical protein A4H97_33985 [Niastella yeongjuensis]|uniref:Uncharacterized protein n=1 Tax=Niastella yeongjuensis TaxID=354355 RepID=A0A1V9EBE6_9BACT|nr:hypothetical protein [Niastella yeongjuensis]OQP43426.1 hypothetical protein A4H97_33985 [Niastella yeongjuensis]